jgi:hypothetical protein
MRAPFRTVITTAACGFRLREMLHRMESGCAIESSKDRRPWASKRTEAEQHLAGERLFGFLASFGAEGEEAQSQSDLER